MLRSRQRKRNTRRFDDPIAAVPNRPCALESDALTKTRRGLRALLDLVPARATILRDGRESTLSPDEVAVGDRLLVKPGERVATDGVIRSGRSALDFSAITGESVPVERGPGDEVFAAAINGGAALEVEVSPRTEDNSLARIVQIVEAAQERKGRSQRLAERIARPLVPGVMVAAFLVAVVGSLLGDPSTANFRTTRTAGGRSSAEPALRGAVR